MTNRSHRILIVSLLAAGFSAGCASPLVERQRLPDGTFRFTCREELWKCLTETNVVCKDGSYEVLYGSQELKVYGTSESYVEDHLSHADVRCLKKGQEPPAPEAVPAASAAPAASSPAKGAGAAPAASASGTRPPPAKPICIPGSTQACVGPAACAGGQACLPDGSGFGPCDCGSAAHP